MRRLTLCERDSLSFGTDEDLSEAEAAEFAKIQPSLPAGSLTWQHRAIRFGPFCGVLRAGDVMVELLPKIADVNGGAKLVHPGGAKLVHLMLCGTRCWGVVPVVHRRDPRCFE